MKTAKGNAGLLDKVIGLGHQPFITAVMTPADVAAMQNLRRSVKPDVRRLVPVKVLSGGHYGFQQTFATDTVALAKKLGVSIRYIFNNGRDTPADITFEQYQAKIYNNSADIEDIIRKASYEELEKNPLGLNYDSRTSSALEGNPIEEVDTRTPRREQSVDGQNRSSNDSGNPEGERGTVPGPPSTTESDAKTEQQVGKAAPTDKPLTLVYGGSFAPVHVGHIEAAIEAVKAAEAKGYTVTRLVLAPSPDSLLNKKFTDKGETPIKLEDRAEMTSRLISSHGTKSAPDNTSFLFQ